MCISLRNGGVRQELSMNWQVCCVCLLLALSFPIHACAEGEQRLATEFQKALSGLPANHPNVLEIRDAAKVFTDTVRDADAVIFLKKAALNADGSKGQLAAFIGLALLAEKHGTTSFLKSCVEKEVLPSRVAFLGISFLPTKDARAIANEVVVDAEQHWQTRSLYLNLLRAVGDRGMLEKLEKVERGKFGPYDLAVLDGTVRFLRECLSLEDQAEQDRWARQELLILQMSQWAPNYRSWKPGLKWTAEQIHQKEKEISIGLLKAKLSSPASESSYDVPVAAALASLQKNRDLLPLLDKWAAANVGIPSDACREAAKQIRGNEKP